MSKLLNECTFSKKCDKKPECEKSGRAHTLDFCSYFFSPTGCKNGSTCGQEHPIDTGRILANKKKIWLHKSTGKEFTCDYDNQFCLQKKQKPKTFVNMAANPRSASSAASALVKPQAPQAPQVSNTSAVNTLVRATASDAVFERAYSCADNAAELSKCRDDLDKLEKENDAEERMQIAKIKSEAAAKRAKINSARMFIEEAKERLHPISSQLPPLPKGANPEPNYSTKVTNPTLSYSTPQIETCSMRSQLAPITLFREVSSPFGSQTSSPLVFSGNSSPISSMSSYGVSPRMRNASDGWK